MFCQKCGSPNDDNNHRCTACGEVLFRSPERMAVEVNSHLAWAILVTILCCVPFGVVAIVYSTNADRAAMQGNLEFARASAKKAMMWLRLGLIAGLTIWIVLGTLIAVLEYQSKKSKRELQLLQNFMREIHQDYPYPSPTYPNLETDYPPYVPPSAPPPSPFGAIAPVPPLRGLQENVPAAGGLEGERRWFCIARRPYSMVLGSAGS
ncbi:MAG: CD225/dispanin family protein [Candidatus Brocadiia bacterium]